MNKNLLMSEKYLLKTVNKIKNFQAKQLQEEIKNIKNQELISENHYFKSELLLSSLTFLSKLYTYIIKFYDADNLYFELAKSIDWKKYKSSNINPYDYEEISTESKDLIYFLDQLYIQALSWNIEM